MLVLGAVGASLAVAGVFTPTGPKKPDPAVAARNRAAARLAALRRANLPIFREGMRNRDAFFVAERSFLTAMSDAEAKIRKYRRDQRSVQREIKRIDEINQPGYDACSQYTDVQCPNPTYPDYPTVPDLSSDIRRLHSAGKQLDGLHASILNVNPPPTLKVFFAQLATAVDALNSDATYNADTLTKAITPPGSASQVEGDSSKGSMDDAQINTLHDEQALPAIRQMNRAAVSVVRQLKLSIGDYDLPAGNDLDPSDHSVAT